MELGQTIGPISNTKESQGIIGANSRMLGTKVDGFLITSDGFRQFAAFLQGCPPRC